MFLGPRNFMIWLKRESLGISGNFFANESTKAFAFCRRSMEFIAAVASRSRLLMPILFTGPLRNIPFVLLLSESTGISRFSFFGVILNVLSESAIRTTDVSAPTSVRSPMPSRPPNG